MTRHAPVSFVALALAMCSLALAVRADDDVSGTTLSPRLARPGALETRTAALRSSSVNTDTLYVGYTPGRFNPATNWWSIGAGKGAGFHRPPAQGGMWDWEPTGASYLHGDSLQGWWPRRQTYTGTGAGVLADYVRPWWAVDYGNQANYVLDNGSGGKRTFGVVGVWHRDDGAASGGGATWTPLEGGYSAWMGLRRHGDVSFVDPITHSPFNDDLTMFAVTLASSPTSDKGYPGYGSQWDQMLYRDIDMSAAPSAQLTLTFSYRTRMSTGFVTSALSRAGWFDKDPLVVTTNGSAQTAPSPGNFISSTTAGNNAPRDSFMVYVGAPTDSGVFTASNSDSFVASTGQRLPIYDPMRRWFAEVVRANEGLYRELESVAGDVGPVTKTVTIPNATLAPILAASQNRVRVVFRVKTNRGFDDESSAYTSGGGGAAVLDAVTYAFGSASSPPGWGDFESASAIDNALAVSPGAAWKSTGKPPGHWSHTHAFADLQYDDQCGQPGDISRLCNMAGVVISMGDHDNNEASGGLVNGTADRETFDGLSSPTIQLCGPYPNPIGIQTADDAIATEDYYLDYEIYTGVFNPFTTGCTWWTGLQSYPERSKASSGGYPMWGTAAYAPYLVFNPDPQCYRDILDNPIKGNGLMRTSNANGVPDSVRFVIVKRVECYRFGASFGCASTAGAYLDNVSFTLVDGTPQPIQAQIWDLYQDTFPANEGFGLAGIASAFDTTSALIKSGVNVAPMMGTSSRFDVPGDSVVVTSAGGGRTRVDLVFRILPGPGNYVTMGRPDLSTLRKLPNSATPIGAPSTTSSNFWENYLADNGPKGTPGGHVGGVWNANVWNSARMDTAEVAIFAYQGRGIIGGPPSSNVWQATYHESELGSAPDPNTEAGGDPYPVTSTRAALAIPRSRCFVAAAGAATTDVQCNGAVPAYVGTVGVPNNTTGFDGTATTVENTKIIPDGYLTPGAHVQYFFRTEVDGVLAGTMPDTNRVFPQNGEGSEDGHRWQQFGVLPDRWKAPSYRHPVYGTFGASAACALVIDNADRRGDERVWVSIADTLGATASNKRGAHNGWATRTTTDVNDPSGFVSLHGGQPGSSWDLYNVKASESLTSSAGSIGNRLAFRDPSNPQINGKVARLGPTPDMLRAYYKIIVFMSGDLNHGILGPYPNRSQDDIAILRDWLQSGNPIASNLDRGLWAIGNGFIESNYGEGSGSPQDNFDTNYLGVDLRNSSYVLETGNSELVPDLLPMGLPSAAGEIFGVRSRCLWTNDVLARSPGLSGETFDLAAYEQPSFPLLTLTSSVFKRHNGSRPWSSLVDGFDIEDLTSRFDANSMGRLRYTFGVLTSTDFGAVCQMVPIVEPPGAPLPPASPLHDYLALDNNPVTTHFARVRFGVARTGPVEIAMYDVTGRRVRTLARRIFPAGDHALTWDGLDDGGVALARGVYFAKIITADTGFEATKKVTLLR